MANNEYTELGTITLEPHQHNLVLEFSEAILNGTFEQAVTAFTVIFEREPKDDLEMQIFKALCEQKIKERDGDYGIKGVFDGGNPKSRKTFFG